MLASNFKAVSPVDLDLGQNGGPTDQQTNQQTDIDK